MREDADASAVSRVQRGDRAAFAELYDRYARLVRCLCFDGIRNLNDSNDLCQEVFLKAFRSIGELRDANRFANWLTGITRNAIRDWHRRHDGSPMQLDEPVPDSEHRDSETDFAELRDAIGALPEQERLALHLFYLDEEPVTVARQVLGLSQSGFYKLLDRARRQVAEKMKATQEMRDE
ncbi:RNA polymerase sigma factor [Schlesneria paludicola]|uniref:RNA polymerase sigma factor n=1 Tax=Schlesneria paludicola TaxID=360056 RepID=UPI000299E22C|nr:sigma-70 family RNA polymerase sigma factor [Schlesneria paludicola]